MADPMAMMTRLQGLARSERSRSDVLRALLWPNAALLASIVPASVMGAPLFILVLLSVLLVLFMLLYAGAYVFFGRQDPNLLRSERYNLEKMAIEHGFYGDSATGLIDATPRTVAQIEARPENAGE